MENLLVPYEAVKSLNAERALVLAPHPDDEVFGCGGAIMRHIEEGAVVAVVIASDGTFGSARATAAKDAEMRRQESLNAADVMGYGSPVFWGLPDRGIEYGEALVARILGAIESHGPDLLYAPSLWEMHPDHRALGMAAAEAVRRHGSALRLAMYEVGVPMRPNLLLDISDLAGRKQAAMACFPSQLKNQPYDQQIAALDRFRTYTLSSAVTAAEAYVLTDAQALGRDALAIYASEYRQQRKLGLAMSGHDLPLVSVIIRSMDRPTLADALDSVALQTYSHIEVVVVNAKGPSHEPTGVWCGRFPMRLVGGDGTLDRGRAANLGMDSAQGKYLIFLDDDDLFLPEHVSRLVDVLQEGKERAAYTGVKQVDESGATVMILDEQWEPVRLRGANYLPIHAVLFERSLRDLGCRFSETLGCMEDWEFWLQVSRHTGFHHVPGVSAIYRIALGTSGLSLAADAEKHLVNRAAIFETWLPRFSSREWVQTIFWFENAHNYYGKLAEQRLEQLRRVEASLAESESRLTEREARLGESERRLTESERQLGVSECRLNDSRRELEQERRERAEHVAALQQTIDTLLNSHSWRIAAPLRFLSRLSRGQYREAFSGVHRRLHLMGKAIYRVLPRRWGDSLAQLAYRSLPERIFRGWNHYELWRRQAIGGTPSGGGFAGMVDDDVISPLTAAQPGTVAIHIHVFYPDLAATFAKSLGGMPFAYDLFVSVPTEEARSICERTFTGLPRLGQLSVAVVANIGRDVAPLFCTFGSALRQYDFIAHFHSKKSLYNRGATSGWLEYLLSSLLGSEQQIRKIFSLLDSSGGYGLVYPQNFSGMPYMANTWLANRSMGRAWCNRLGIGDFPDSYFDYPVGSMFWARSEALLPLFDAGIREADFPVEAGQTDGTLAHCLERMFVLVARRSGFKAAILRDKEVPDWSPWRFGQYLARSRESAEAMLVASDVRVVVFDIFDTLLVRPLLNPESIKHLVARRAGHAAAEAYLSLRGEAEMNARQHAGRDIGLEEVFVEFAALSGLQPETVAQLRRLEETIEQEAVTSRPDAVALLRHALSAGKRVILASDMYLPRPIVETMLTENGIGGYHALYLSSDIGKRKDTGELFQHILSTERAVPSEVLMVGDNERSDFQIPADMGMKFFHVLRPVELARALPRLGPLVERSLHDDDPGTQLTLGLIVRENFKPLFYPRFDPAAFVPPDPRSVGYSVLGPLVLSFAQWLAKTAKADGVQHLYFLSREGQFLQMVYDQLLSSDREIGPPAEYLVLSRRAVTVPMIAGLDDIYALAATRFYPKPVANFLHERYGLILDDAEWGAIWHEGLWRKDQLVEVIDGEIEHLKPLLQFLKGRILSLSHSERPGLMAYLEHKGLSRAERNYAVVDVGYSATIQGRLNRLLNRAVHGYYLATDHRAEAVSSQHGVTALGCFAHHAVAGAGAPAVLRESFTLEKLLSSDEAQVVRYQVDAEGVILSESRQLSDEEMQTRSLRAAIRNGAIEFVRDALALRSVLFEDFVVPVELAASLYAGFVDGHADTERAMLKDMILDDHYCGRGLVS